MANGESVGQSVRGKFLRYKSRYQYVKLGWCKGKYWVSVACTRPAVHLQFIPPSICFQLGLHITLANPPHTSPITKVPPDPYQRIMELTPRKHYLTYFRRVSHRPAKPIGSDLVQIAPRLPVPMSRAPVVGMQIQGGSTKCNGKTVQVYPGK